VVKRALPEGCALHLGDARAMPVADGTVACVVTSPPYWRQRKDGSEIGTGTLAEYVEQITDAFREVRRVLRDNGVAWLNLGDKFEDKNLIGVPWRVAFALKADGWLLRQPVIWFKLNAVPDGAKDRPGSDYEHCVHAGQEPSSFYDGEAVKQDALWERWGRQTVPKYAGSPTATGWMQPKELADFSELRAKGKNLRSVWPVPTANYPGAHQAVMPAEVAGLCIAASSRKDDLVLDPFAGTGTTLVAALQLGRRAVGVEINRRRALRRDSFRVRNSTSAEQSSGWNAATAVRVPGELHRRLSQHLRRLDADPLVVRVEGIQPDPLDLLALGAEDLAQRAADRERNRRSPFRCLFFGVLGLGALGLFGGGLLGRAASRPAHRM
jgi:site-specific DNA-methyltransferase (adenine-specific)